MEYSLILLAAGKGERSRLSYNKVLFEFDDHQTVLERSIDTFSNDPDCAQIIVVCAPYEKGHFADLLKDRPADLVIGGATRQESVSNGLQAVKEGIVFIHDGARPFVSADLIERIKEGLEEADSVLPMIAAKDTMKLVDENGFVEKTLDRSRLFHAQTPQAFKTDLIKDVHHKAKEAGYQGTDDCSLVEVFSDAKTKMVQGDEANFKITSKEDVERLRHCS